MTCKICKAKPAEFGRYCAPCIDRELPVEDLEVAGEILDGLVKGSHYRTHEDALR